MPSSRDSYVHVDKHNNHDARKEHRHDKKRKRHRDEREREEDSRRRHHHDHDRDREFSKNDKERDSRHSRDSKNEKRRKVEQDESKAEEPSPGMLTTTKIQEMMAHAQRDIQERKSQLIRSGTMPIPENISPAATQSTSLQLMHDAVDKARRAEELQASINSRFASLSNSHILSAQAASRALASAAKPSPLILDAQGRTIDATTGQAVQLSSYQPTLKANIRAKKRESFKAAVEKPVQEIHKTSFFDPRIDQKLAARPKRGFRFHEKGKFEQLANRMRTKAQLFKLQQEIAEAAKKTGIASAAKLAIIAPKKMLDESHVPDVEWWDTVIVRHDSYENVLKRCEHDELNNFENISNLIEHPTEMKPPAEPVKPIRIPVMLTKKEHKKLRRQKRQEMQKDQQEQIRLGLIPPPEPKVRLANLMRVLGTEAVQDPTKVEAHVRAQMEKRQRKHEEDNAARKLTAAEKREKAIRKIKEDVTTGVHVSVYRVRSFHNPSKKFKVETNCKQLLMTGMIVLYKDCNVVVVEGGPKQQKKFKNLLLNRIKWKDEIIKTDSEEQNDEDLLPRNDCNLVWQGEVHERSFGEIKMKMCPTEAFAREQFCKHGVEHYWDIAFSGAVLETVSNI